MANADSPIAVIARDRKAKPLALLINQHKGKIRRRFGRKWSRIMFTARGAKVRKGRKQNPPRRRGGAEKSKNNIAADNTGECEIRKRFGREST